MNSRRNGAPVEACGNVTDIAPDHGPNNSSSDDVPYYVEFQFYNETYIPDYSHTCKCYN